MGEKPLIKIAWLEVAPCEIGEDSIKGCGNRAVFSLKGRCDDLEGMSGKSIKIYSLFYLTA
jgi:hypothetical protein